MSDIRRIAVLDVGKTNAKVAVVDCATGRELDVRRMANRVLSGPPYPHYDIDALWTFFRQTLREFAASYSFDAISITTHGASAALIDADGGLALPVLDYEHHYPAAIVAEYAALRPAFSETFSPLLSGGLNLGAQLHYLKAELPDAFSRVAQIMTYPQYWAFLLTGVAANEVTSLGCHTDLWRPREGQFSSLVDSLDIRSQMAPVRSAFDRLGPVKLELAAELGLVEPVEVYCGIHDSNASLLPHLIGREPPFAVISTGTWVISFAVGGDLDHLDPARDTLANVDAYGRAVPSSRFMGGREFELLTAEFGALVPDAALAAIPDVVRQRRMLLPNLAEGSGPFSGRRHAWVGCEGASNADIWAAACLYLAMMTEACLGLIGARGPVLVEGPFAANAAYLAALRALLGRDVFGLSGATGTTQGAALLVGVELAPAERQAVAAIEIHGLDAYRDNWKAHVADARKAGPRTEDR